MDVLQDLLLPLTFLGEFTPIFWCITLFAFLTAIGGIIKGLYSSIFINIMILILYYFIIAKFVNINFNYTFVVMFLLAQIITTIIILYKS
ncbi:MAG: hypothetical protein QW197_03735 [Candidatus Aenigmatarchaeota archaeon]